VANPTETVAARIGSDSKTKLTRAAEECDLTVSGYLEGVIEDHIDRNPHGLRALVPPTAQDPDQVTITTPEESPDGFVDEMLEGLE